MGGIRSAIELQDNFTGVLMNIFNAVNMALSPMEQMQSVMGGAVDISGIERANEAVRDFNDTLQDMEAPPVISPAIDYGNIQPAITEQPAIDVPEEIQFPVQAVVGEQPQIDVPDRVVLPVEPVITEQPAIDVPEEIQFPVQAVVGEQPQIDVPDRVVLPVEPVITEQPAINIPNDISVDVSTNGIPEMEQQIAEITNRLGNVTGMQDAIKIAGKGLYILPEEAVQNIAGVNREIEQMRQTLEFLQSNPFHLDASITEMQIKAISGSLDEVIAKQQQLDELMDHVPSQMVDVNVNPVVSDLLVENTDIAVPVRWQADDLQVFTDSGIERFEQEVQSTNNMLNTLSQTQAQIAARAAQTDIFPPGMAADMGSMQGRLQAIQNRIQAIEGSPLSMGMDEANAELEQLRAQLNQAVQEQEIMNHAVENMDVQAANEAYLRLSQIIGGTERHIRDNVDEQGRLNREIEQGTNEANELMQTVMGIVATYVTAQTFSNILDLSDQLASTAARLDMMNDGLQTTQNLQNMIYLSAERARGAYQATADAVSKLGLMAGDAFSSSEEIIVFMEQVNKQFRIAGTEAAGIDAAMLQLTQAMGSGVLRGEEYNSILEQAPNIIQTIADYLEVPKGQLKDMAAEGKITADIVKAAMFAAADETNAQFESMTMTFEQIETSLENTALMALQPLLDDLNKIANSDAFQQVVSHAADALSMLAAFATPIMEEIANAQVLWNFVNGAIDGITVIGRIALEIFDLLAAGALLVADNWSQLSPVIYGVAGALAVYYGWQLAANSLGLISKGIHMAMAAAQMTYAAATGALTAAKAAEIAAQNGLNAAMYACPIVWIISLIIILIALFYTAVAVINKCAKTSVSATGIICGVFMVAAAFIGNQFVALINFVIDNFVVLWNFIAAFANFFANVFTDPVGAIARLFFDLVDCILGLLESLASAIDTIFGSNLADSVAGWRDSLGSWVDATFGQGEEIMAKMDASSLHLEHFEYSSAWDAGYTFGEGVEESIANFDPSALFGTTELPSADDYASVSEGIDDIAGNTGAIADAMDITGEELKYLRDIAEQEAVNRFTTADIHLEQTNHNTIKNGMDLDGIMAGMEDLMNEAIDIATEGVHE